MTADIIQTRLFETRCLGEERADITAEMENYHGGNKSRKRKPIQRKLDLKLKVKLTIGNY